MALLSICNVLVIFFYLMFTLCNSSIVIISLFGFLFTFVYLFVLSLFNLNIFLGMKWVFCRQCIVGFHFIYSSFDCRVWSFAFKVVTVRELLPVFCFCFLYSSYSFFDPRFLHYCLFLCFVDKWHVLIPFSFSVYSIDFFPLVSIECHI